MHVSSSFLQHQKHSNNCGANSGFKLAEIETSTLQTTHATIMLICTFCPIEILLSVLVDSFKFSPADKDVVWNMAFVVYPTVGTDSTKATLPLVVEKVIPQ